jgi:O-6-methylguanine DNA methyltransferase
MSFQDKVYRLIRTIPEGKVATYGQIAKLVGSPGAARAVGMCMKINPDAPRTPCHRIVASDGRLTGYSAEGGIRKKKQMLLSEGVSFVGDRVDLGHCLWRPSV